MEAFRKHIKALGGNIRVNTDVLSIETETYPFTTERKYNVELSRETLTTFASPIEGMPKISVTQPGGWVQGTSLRSRATAPNPDPNPNPNPDPNPNPNPNPNQRARSWSPWATGTTIS